MTLLETGWPTAPLGRVVKINARTLPETTDPGFEFRYIDIGSVGRGALIEEPQMLTFENSPSRARRILRPGDTIISTVRTYLRAVLPIRDDASDLIASTGFAVLSPGADLDDRFLSWYAQSDPFIEEVVARSVGVSYPAIAPTELARFPVPMPTLTQQRAIADFLDAETARIDALIENKRRMRRLLVDRFAAHVEQHTRARSVAADKGDSLPDKWRLVVLRRCFRSIQYGIGEASREAGAIAVLGMGNVDRGEIVGNPSGFVDEIDPALLLEPGDLLFNRTNSLALVGKVALVRSSATITFASYLVRLRTNNMADSIYLNYLLNTRPILEHARSMALPSIGQANLNPSRYTSIRVPLPPIQVQRSIVDGLDQKAVPHHRLSIDLTRQINLLSEHRQALITAAVTGQIEVPEAAASCGLER